MLGTIECPPTGNSLKYAQTRNELFAPPSVSLCEQTDLTGRSPMEQVWQHLGVSAHNPVRQFQIVYCTWLAIAMLCNMRNHCRFYRWFSSSRCCRTMARACCAPHACCHAPHARHATLCSLLAAFRSRASEASARTRRRSMAQRPRL